MTIKLARIRYRQYAKVNKANKDGNRVSTIEGGVSND